MSELNTERWHALSPYLDQVLEVPADGRVDLDRKLPNSPLVRRQLTAARTP